MRRALQMPLFTLQHAQGERKSEEAGCRVLRPFVLSLPVLSFSKGSKHEQSRALVLVISNAIVHPSTGSGRTENEHVYRALQMPLFTLRQAQGER